MAAGLIGHLWQVFHVDVDVARLICLEGAVFRSGCPVLEVAQVSHALPPQAAVQPGARGVRVQEFPDRRQQVVERDRQRLAKRHCDGFLRGRQRRLKTMRGVAAILDTVTLAPLVDGLPGSPQTLRQHRRSLCTRLDRGPDLRCRRCLLVKMDQHGRTPSRTSLRADLATNSADRRGLMQSSGMEHLSETPMGRTRYTDFMTLPSDAMSLCVLFCPNDAP